MSAVAGAALTGAAAVATRSRDRRDRGDEVFDSRLRAAEQELAALRALANERSNQ